MSSSEAIWAILEGNMNRNEGNSVNAQRATGGSGANRRDGGHSVKHTITLEDSLRGRADVHVGVGSMDIRARCRK